MRGVFKAGGVACRKDQRCGFRVARDRSQIGIGAYRNDQID